MEAEMAANLSREWETGRARLSESLCARLERGRDVRALDYLRALTRIPELHASFAELDRKSTRLNSSHGYISYAVFCLKKKKKKTKQDVEILETSTYGPSALSSH